MDTTKKKATRERIQFTDTKVKALKPGPVNYAVWDLETHGLGVQVTPGGAKTFVWKYSFNGRQRWMTIGNVKDWTTAKARKRISALSLDIDNGIDPAAAAKADKANPTVAEFAQTFLEEWCCTRKPSTQDGYKTIITKYINKPLGKLLVKDIKLAHVDKVFREIRDTFPTQANRMVAVMSSILAFAERRGHRTPGTNPCKAIEKVPEHVKTRYLSGEELGRLLDTLQAQELRYPYQVRLIRLLLLTGARLREILHCRWSEKAGGNPLHSYLNKAGAFIHCEDHKGSRKGGPKDIQLSKAALEVIKALEPLRHGSPYLFQSPDDPKKPLANPHHAWDGQTIRGKKMPGLRDLAELPGVRLHDLRHSFGTLSVTLNQNPTVRQKLLGHASAASTARYSHVDQDPQKAAVEEIGKTITKIGKAKRPNK